MLWGEIGYLYKETEHLDSLGKPQKSYKYREVFCNEKGVKRSEFYQGQAQGYRPELCVEIHKADYKKEGHFFYDGTLYRVIRTYPVKNECLELICQSLVERRNSMPSTSAFIKAARVRINQIVTCYYDEAPTQDAPSQYCVLNGIHVTDLEDGDLISFYLDIWVNENEPDATVELEELCDKIRNELRNEVISVDGVFMAHIGFESRGAEDDKEFDIAHRRLSMSARAFYY